MMNVLLYQVHNVVERSGSQVHGAEENLQFPV